MDSTFVIFCCRDDDEDDGDITSVTVSDGGMGGMMTGVKNVKAMRIEGRWL